MPGIACCPGLALNMDDMSRIIIIGAGAMGSFLAARLSEAGRDVILIARGVRLDFIRRNGVVLREGGVERAIGVTVAEKCPDPDDIALAIVATKTTDMASALAVLSPLAPRSPDILTLQNGVEAPHEVVRALPIAEVYGARVHGFFDMDGPVVRHVGVAPSILFGSMPPEPRRNGTRIMTALRSAGIAADHVPDIRPALWEKFLLASAAAGVGVALGMPAGMLCHSPEPRAMLEQALHEIAAIAAASGIKLPSSCVADTLAFVATFPAEARSSLQRDLEAKRPSEYRHLTGAVRRFAAALGMATPVHDRIERMIQARGLLPDTETGPDH